MNPIVYFTKDISSKKIVEIYEKLGVELKGKVALKLHSGEDGNQNYLKPEFYKDIVEKLNATVVECNTAYEGERNSTDKHKKLIEKHGWDKYYNVDLMDAEGPDDVLEVKNGFVLKENYVGKNMKNYDSMLVVSHFKGHPMGGYGGALDRFLESMADAASTIVDHFKGQILFISVMKNMSVDCDCCAVAEDPCMKDIGILASTDPVALDQACIDLVNKSDDPGKEHFLERVNSRHGTYTIECAEKLGVGSTKYELVEF